MSLDDVLSGVARLGLDTAPIIYFVKAHPRYDAVMTEVFRRIADGTITGVTSVITLTEVLVHPLRQGRRELQLEYRDLLLQSANFEIVPLDVAAAERAADLRARYNVRTPDALQLAAALAAGCDAFLTNDASLKRVTEIKVLVVAELPSR
ncbi:tRNA(fMet)-specific endonuclease VapC [bacterium HR10]|nr:tRNA(fMet)-specific endonuclease VapC [bacterium HR10]